MIFYLIMCHVLLSLLRVTASNPNDDQLINKRCTHDVGYKSKLLNHKINEHFQTKSTSIPKVDTWYYNISKNLSSHCLNKDEVVIPLLLLPKVKVVDKEITTKKYVDLVIDSFDSKTKLPNVKLKEDNDMSFFEFHQLCTTEKRSLGCIENLQMVRPLNLKFPTYEINEYKTRKCDEIVEVITVLPAMNSDISKKIDLVFPLKGKPPPLYRCFKVKNDSDSSKTLNIYKLIKPQSELTEIDKGKIETKMTPLKVKRQGYWIELQSPLSTPIYPTKQMSKTRVMNIFKPKNKGKKKYKTKKNKKKKFTKLDENIDMTSSNAALSTKELKPNQSCHDVEIEKGANGTQKFDVMNKDQEKIFIESKEADHNTTCEETSFQNSTDKPLTNNSFSDSTPNSIKNNSTKPKQEDKSVKDKPAINEKTWDKPSLPSSLKELFSRSTYRQIQPTVTEDPASDLSTKFVYGHELHV